jgi:hypothetical protein
MTLCPDSAGTPAWRINMAKPAAKKSARKRRRKLDTYVARADQQIALAVAGAAASPFTITVRFLGGLTQKQKGAFRGAADRWARMIVGDLPPVEVDGEIIDDVLILAQGTTIDGPGGILGQAGPTHLRPASTGAAAFIPAKGIMSFDKADLKEMEKNGTLSDVITHEMGHVLGIGTIWSTKGLLQGAGSANPTFAGPAAMVEYGNLRGTGAPTPVPVENTGGQGTQDAHWRETIFRSELMSGFIAGANNPISRVTVASLQDLGYTVDLNAAEPYMLPDLLMLAESGLLMAHVAPIDAGMMLPNIPTVLPAESLQ